MPSTLKKSKFRPRLFKKRKRHSTSAANVAEWACERSPSEEVAQSDGEGHVPWEGGVKDEVEGGDVVETPEEFIEWLCGKKEQRHKMKPEAVKEDETCFRVSPAISPAAARLTSLTVRHLPNFKQGLRRGGEGMQAARYRSRRHHRHRD
jgi:hypothetical protein